MTFGHRINASLAKSQLKRSQGCDSFILFYLAPSGALLLEEQQFRKNKITSSLSSPESISMLRTSLKSFQMVVLNLWIRFLPETNTSNKLSLHLLVRSKQVSGKTHPLPYVSKSEAWKDPHLPQVYTGNHTLFPIPVLWMLSYIPSPIFLIVTIRNRLHWIWTWHLNITQK